MQRTQEAEEIIYQRFQIPEEGRGLLDLFFSEEEQELILSAPEEFPREAYPAAQLESAYQRGVVDKADQEGTRYRLGTFYGMLDVFAISRQKEYDGLPEERRRALDQWYFDAYCEGLDPDQTKAPTEDRVLPLEETLEFIDQQDRPAYLNHCDCRRLKGDCGLPTLTCITYRNGVNSFVDRGLSQPLSKEEVKEVIRQADAVGLMHTVNDHGICNCCGDCCYLFRGQERRDSLGLWPGTDHRVQLDPDACVGCGRCVERCPFSLFEFVEASESGVDHQTVQVRSANCVGCGLCVNTCPTGALTLGEREG